MLQSFRGCLYVCPIIIFSLLYNLPKFFEVRTACSVTVTSTNITNTSSWVSIITTIINLFTVLQVMDKYIWDKREVRTHRYYMTYITANCIVMGLLPMLLLSILNWLIFRAISRAHALHASLMSGNAHRRDNTMATVLTAIVVVFVVCHTPKAVLNIYEVWAVSIQSVNTFILIIIIFFFQEFFGSPSDISLFLDIFTNISHLLIVTNSSVNIIVYALKVSYYGFTHFKYFQNI